MDIDLARLNLYTSAGIFETAAEIDPGFHRLTAADITQKKRAQQVGLWCIKNSIKMNIICFSVFLVCQRPCTRQCNDKQVTLAPVPLFNVQHAIDKRDVKITGQKGVILL